jgi:hypothetical protein
MECYKNDIYDYILNGKIFELHRVKKISVIALSQIIEELDAIVEYICYRLKSNYYFVDYTLTEDMILSCFPMVNPESKTYDDNIVTETFFIENHLKDEFVGRIAIGNLSITDGAYVEILKVIHKRFDNMIEMALSLSSSNLLNRTKLKRDVIIISAKNLRICFEENDDE